MQLAILPSGARPTPTFGVGDGRFREQGRTIVPPHRSVALEHDNRTQDPRISPLSTHTRPRTPSQHITTPRRTGNSSRFGPSSHILGGGDRSTSRPWASGRLDSGEVNVWARHSPCKYKRWPVVLQQCWPGSGGTRPAFFCSSCSDGAQSTRVSAKAICWRCSWGGARAGQCPVLVHPFSALNDQSPTNFLQIVSSITSSGASSNA